MNAIFDNYNNISELELNKRISYYEQVDFSNETIELLVPDTVSYVRKIFNCLRWATQNRVIIEDGVAKLPDRSSFAGSIGTMDRAFKFAVQNAELPLQTASKLVSLTPAKLMGISAKKGSIAIGKDADFVLLDDELNVKQVYVNAQEVA